MLQPLAPRGVQAGIPGTLFSGLDKPFYGGELDRGAMQWGREVVIWGTRGSSDPSVSI